MLKKKQNNRKQVYSAEVAANASGSVKAQGKQIKIENSQSKGRGYDCDRGRGFSRDRGRANGAPRGGGHQISFCKTELSRKSDDRIESIYQNKIGSSLNSVSKEREGV